MKYQQGKERARDCAIEWQLDYKLADFCEYFRRLGKRYGLWDCIIELKELVEEGSAEK